MWLEQRERPQWDELFDAAQGVNQARILEARMWDNHQELITNQPGNRPGEQLAKPSSIQSVSYPDHSIADEMGSACWREK
jgi:hypothetical protein